MTILDRLVVLTTALTAGHHVDHVIRGNHIGWPFSSQATPFTLSLAVYPAVLLGLYLQRRGRTRPLYWAVLWGAMTLLAASVHLPLNEQSETMGDIIGPYASPLAGWIAFSWLVVLITAALMTCVVAAKAWRDQQHADTSRTSTSMEGAS